MYFNERINKHETIPVMGYKLVVHLFIYMYTFNTL